MRSHGVALGTLALCSACTPVAEVLRPETTLVVTAPSATVAIATPSFLPLAEGNTWTYQYGTTLDPIRTHDATCCPDAPFLSPIANLRGSSSGVVMDRVQRIQIDHLEQVGDLLIASVSETIPATSEFSGGTSSYLFRREPDGMYEEVLHYGLQPPRFKLFSRLIPVDVEVDPMATTSLREDFNIPVLTTSTRSAVVRSYVFGAEVHVGGLTFPRVLVVEASYECWTARGDAAETLANRYGPSQRRLRSAYAPGVGLVWSREQWASEVSLDGWRTYSETVRELATYSVKVSDIDIW